MKGGRNKRFLKETSDAEKNATEMLLSNLSDHLTENQNPEPHG